MAELKVNVWGLCPFRSPVATPEEPSPVVIPMNPPVGPPQALGPCLYAACGMWKITRMQDGKPIDGMCGLRYTAECLGEVAGSLQILTKLAMKLSGEKLPTSAGPNA